MPIGPDTARNPRPEDFPEIDRLLSEAFGQSAEVELVHRLRASGTLVQELVTCWPDPSDGGRAAIGAYAAVSRMVAPRNWFCLAPLAVRRDWQGGALAPDPSARNHFRFGTRLARMVAFPFTDDLARAMLSRAGLLDGDEPPTLVVLGRPSFYTRCGFSLPRAARLISPYPIKNTLIARPGSDVPQETLVYPPAFSGV